MTTTKKESKSADKIAEEMEAEGKRLIKLAQMLKRPKRKYPKRRLS